MLGVYDFCAHYEWTFEWLRREGGEELVEEYWQEAISHDSQRHARELIEAGGFAGMEKYWGHTLDEEGAKCVITPGKNVFRIDMHECPSKGFLLKNNLEQYHDYCDHCIGWIEPVLRDAGFRVDHEHDHLGRCWWEMRTAEDQASASEAGEVAGEDDIRLHEEWNKDDNLDSFSR